MDTIDMSVNAGDRAKILPLKPKFTFLAISVAATVVLTVLFVAAYVSFIDKLPLDRMSRHAYDSFGERREFVASTAQGAMMVGLTGLLQFAAWVCSVIAVSMFYYRAYTNLYIRGIQGLSYTPGMAVGWFFIPFVNLVMPLLVTNQLWKASQLLGHNENGNWRSEKNNPFIILWYVSFIGFFLYYFFCVFTMIGNVASSAVENPYLGHAEREEFAAHAAVGFLKMVMWGQAVSVAFTGIFLILFSRQINELHQQAE